MIPKIIHYVWVGGNPLTPLAEKCIETWKKYCPDYEIKRWDETTFDINSNNYCKQAYESKKWAFVSDYIRLFVLYEYGGIYMDTDVEVTKPLDEFLKHPAFSGFEDDEHIPTGIIASEKGNRWVEQQLRYYDDKNFILEDGKLDLTTNVITITNITMKLYPNLELDNTFKDLGDVVFYPKDYFCPISSTTKEMILTKNTHTIHHFSGSWVEKPKGIQSLIIKFKVLIKKIIGKKNTQKYIDYKRKKRQRKEVKKNDKNNNIHANL